MDRFMKILKINYGLSSEADQLVLNSWTIVPCLLKFRVSSLFSSMKFNSKKLKCILRNHKDFACQNISQHNTSYLITARKRSLRRLCFYTYLSFCLGEGGWYSSMHHRSHDQTLYKQLHWRTVSVGDRTAYR